MRTRGGRGEKAAALGLAPLACSVKRVVLVTRAADLCGGLPLLLVGRVSAGGGSTVGALLCGEARLGVMLPADLSMEKVGDGGDVVLNWKSKPVVASDDDFDWTGCSLLAIVMVFLLSLLAEVGCTLRVGDVAPVCTLAFDALEDGIGVESFEDETEVSPDNVIWGREGTGGTTSWTVGFVLP